MQGGGLILSCLQGEVRVPSVSPKPLVAAATYLGTQLEGVEVDLSMLLLASGADLATTSKVILSSSVFYVIFTVCTDVQNSCYYIRQHLFCDILFTYAP